MKIVFVITNLAGGGAEKAILKLASGLTERHHEIEVVLLEDRIEHIIPAGVQIHAIAQKTSKGWLGKQLLAHRLRHHLEKQKADLIVSTLPFADEVTSLAKPPHHWCRIANTLNSEIHALSLGSPAKAHRRLKRYQHLYGKRPLIAVSTGVANDLRQCLNITTKIKVIPNPFDLDAIRKAAVSTSPGLPEHPYVIHVGRFAPQKRHDLLLDAWSQINTPHILVLLTAEDPKLQAMINARGLDKRVHIAGFQPNPYPWIAKADLLVLCSDHEGLPNVLIEALACGTPAVSTDCPSGPKEILTAFPECLVPCGDARSLAMAITHCLASPPDIGRADLTPYSATGVLDAYEALTENS